MRAFGTKYLGFLLVTSCLSPAAFAQAQSSAEPQAAGAAPSDEIIVTARRRDESLSKVPIAITAIGSEQLAARSITNENDLQSAVPGLTIRQNGGPNAFNYVIRGQTIDTYTNSPPGVLPYINEAQVVTLGASAFYDLGGIQVVKGPQGTLFGRNATGGAVLYQTAKTSDEFGGYISGRFGNYDSHHVEGAINFAISDAIKLRIAASETGGGAFVRNLNTNQLLGNLEQRSIRGTLTIEPTAGLTNTTVVQHTTDGGTNTPSLAYHSSFYKCGNAAGLNSNADCAYGPLNPGFAAYLAAHPNLFTGGVTAYANLQDSLGNRVARNNAQPFHKAKSTFAINTTSFEVSSDITIKNIMMYNKASADDGADYDGTPYPIFQHASIPSADVLTSTNIRGLQRTAKQFSNELQLQGKAMDGALSYTLGLYYINESSTLISGLTAFDFSPLAAATTFNYAQAINNKSYAGFAQLTYKLTDQLNLTGGFRYTKEDQRAQLLPESIFTFFTSASDPLFHQSRSTSKPSWNVSLDYAVTPSLLVYATTRGSWRAGGFNYTVFPGNSSAVTGGNQFDPETTKDVEIGLKYNGRDLGVPVTFNLAGYNQWVNNIQRAAFPIGFGGTPTLITINVPKAKITGVEADFTVRATDWLNLGAAVTYTNARFTNNRVNINLGAPVTYLYGPYADSPKWIESAFVEISKDLGSDVGQVTLRGDVFKQSINYFSNLADTIAPGTDIQGYTLANARLTWSDVMGKPVTVAAFVRNIGDKQYYAGGNATGPNLGVNFAFSGQPRTYGLEVKVKF